MPATPSLPDNIRADQIMQRKLITLPPELDVFKGIEILVKHQISGAGRGYRGTIAGRLFGRVLYEGVACRGVRTIANKPRRCLHGHVTDNDFGGR